MSLPSLSEIADKTMAERGFAINFPEEIIEEKATITPLSSSNIDLRHLPFFSIDNPSSQDLDQLSYAETLSLGTFKIYVAIADVDSYVKKNSLLDTYAGFNTTSVYTPTKIFPMLPEQLSYNLSSLLPYQDRVALVVETEVSESGEMSFINLYYAQVKNQAKLNYIEVAAFLDKNIPLSIEPVIAEQLHLQNNIAQRIKKLRLQKGALEFKTRNAVPIVEKQQVVGTMVEPPNSAHDLIENMMIATNLSCYQFLKNSHSPRLCRIVKTPKNWQRIVEMAKEKNFDLPEVPAPIALSRFLHQCEKNDPDSYPDISLAIIKLLGHGEYIAVFNDEDETLHFGLRLKDYTHATAPNRRYVDLIMSRLIKAALSKILSPYTKEELQAIAANCTQREAEAEKVERKLTKCAIARLFMHRIGEEFEAIITGASEKGVFVRVFAVPVEGKLVKAKSKKDVGEKLSIRLVHVDPLEGFIDFVEI